MRHKCERCGKQDEDEVSLVTYFWRANGNSMAETKQLCQNCKPLFVRYLRIEVDA